MPSARSTRLRRTWDQRTDSWHSHVTASSAFELIRDAIVEACEVQPGDTVVDLGAGTGFVSLELAQKSGIKLLAVDMSAEMLEVLRRDAESRRLLNVTTQCADLATFDLPKSSADVVVTNYALHHLEDDAKRALVARSYSWLRPGGRLVIADMMFSRGATREDRRIIITKVTRLIRRGPGGAWRVVKNVVRFGFRRGSELPVSRSFWVDALARAGFTEVSSRSIVEEAGLVCGRRP